jgi:ketosteroid isomerase-like protein
VSAADVELVQAAIHANQEGDVGAWLRLADDDIRVIPRPAEPDAKPEYRGLEGLMEYATNWVSQFESYDILDAELTDAGDAVLGALRERGVLAGSGLEVVETFGHSFVVRDGKLVEWRMYDSVDDARRAVGLD